MSLKYKMCLQKSMSLLWVFDITVPHPQSDILKKTVTVINVFAEETGVYGISTPLLASVSHFLSD